MNRIHTALLLVGVAAIVTACGGSSTSSPSPTTAAPGTDTTVSGGPGGAKKGGILLAGIPDNPDHLDPALSATNEGWELMEAMNNGLLTLRRTDGIAGSDVVPDLAVAMPKISADGKTYVFTMRRGVMFSAPIKREVMPSDVKFSIERLFRVDSTGVTFYGGIVGADAYAKTRKGGISGIIANDATRTISFKLKERDGTFLDYLAVPYSFALPKGTPDKDISTLPGSRVATGPYMIKSYVPKQKLEIRRNPDFKQWTPNTPDGNIDGIDVSIGVTPAQAVNLTATGKLDWYFEPIAPDRYTELKKRSPELVHDFVRGNTTFFVMNERKPPFDRLAVRQAVNFALDRSALVRIFGGQGTPTENIIPPGMGGHVVHNLYPYDLAKAKALVKQSGTAGMKVEVWAPTTDPDPKAAQYVAGVLKDLGYQTSVKTLNESVYWDLIATQKGDPQISFDDWNQDYPEAQDFIDLQFNGEHIVETGNNVISNSNVLAINKAINVNKTLPLGAKRNAVWASLDKRLMAEDAGWAPFMHRQIPKFVSPRVHGLVFNSSFYELFPSMWLSK